MKFQLLFLIFIVPVTLSERIKIKEKGVYPDDSTKGERILAIEKDPQNETRAESQPIPSYFATEKPKSLKGWLPKPKNITHSSSNSTESNLVKDGFCEHTLNYGIRCGKRMDQCRRDSNCPGVTKCCLVSDCGFMCVKPKAKLKHQVVQKKRQTAKESLRKEVVTTAEGLKVEDITKMPELKNSSKTTTNLKITTEVPAGENSTKLSDVESIPTSSVKVDNTAVASDVEVVTKASDIKGILKVPKVVVNKKITTEDSENLLKH